MNWPIKIQGRYLTKTDIQEINHLLTNNPRWNRSRLSRELCNQWGWIRPDGQLKDIACRELLRKLENRTLIKLPERERRSGGPYRLPENEAVEIEHTPIACKLSEIKPIKIVNARENTDSNGVFNYLLKTYHYLSFGRTVGQNMKYLIQDRQGRYLGCVLFGAAAWKVEDRDNWLKWSKERREQNLNLICSNTRFLILNWIRVPHLASHVLGASMRRLSKDWKSRYGTDIALVETFVDTTRYLGTCYKAANFVKIGKTKGRSRQDRHGNVSVPIKDIYVYPLRNNFRDLLNSKS